MEQVFLLGYRAQCHELYQKAVSQRNQPKLRNLIDRGLSEEDQRGLQQQYQVFGAGVAKGLEDAEKLKRRLDRSLLGDFSAWTAAVIHFEGRLSIASTGAPTPNYDLNGQRLQVLHDVSTDVQPLYYATVAETNGGAFVFMWAKESDESPSVELKHRRMVLRVRPGTTQNKRETVVEEWYRDQVKNAVPLLLTQWQPLMGVRLERFFV